MSTPPDLLRFNGVLDQPYIIGWTGPWPPPQHMIMAVGNRTDTVSIFEDADPKAITTAKAIARVYRMDLGQHSVLDESVKGPNLTRCAEYTVERTL